MDIIEFLAEQDIKENRNTIMSNNETLQNLESDIMCIKSTPKQVLHNFASI